MDQKDDVIQGISVVLLRVEGLQRLPRNCINLFVSINSKDHRLSCGLSLALLQNNIKWKQTIIRIPSCMHLTH